MGKRVDEYLLKKYAISQTDHNYEPRNELCAILDRLNKNRKLDDNDKKWIRKKGMFRFENFLKNWEKTGKPDFYTLHKSCSFPYQSYMAPKESDHTLRVSTYLTIKPEDDHSAHRVIYSSQSNNHIDLHIENTRYSSKSIRNTSPSITTQKNNNNSKRNGTSVKQKECSSIDVSTNMRKPHMALHYKKAKLMEHIKSNLEQITPSNIPVDISSLFLPKIWDTLNESIKKDINELFDAYYYKLWTSASLMAYRIFENVLKVHINHDLKEEPAIDITDAIKKLEKHKYDSDLIKILYELREYRNSFMHGNTRASTQEAKESIVKVISLAMNIHNIKP